MRSFAVIQFVDSELYDSNVQADGFFMDSENGVVTFWNKVEGSMNRNIAVLTHVWAIVEETEGEQE